MDILLRNIELEDLEEYRNWKLPHHAYHQWNGPYFKKKTIEEIDLQIESLREILLTGKKAQDQKRIISNGQNEIIGEVSWYWKSEETKWMEIGVVIFNENFWNKGIGYLALKLWIEEIFQSKKEIHRLGVSTWSGNNGMIKLAEKVGMKKEATYRKARIVDGEYYDSVSYGILREEWNAKENK